MTSSYTLSATATFTITHARHMAAKVATDLKRMQRLYGSPLDALIDNFEAEATALIKAGYLNEVTYGFQRSGQWIEPTLRYTARDLAGLNASDDDPGRVRPGADVSSASFGSFLTYSTTWFSLSASQQAAFNATVPVSRTTGSEPAVNGYLSRDRTYSAGGHALDRAMVRSW